MSAVSALNKKRAAQAALQTVKKVRVCLELEATENTLQRLSALMMLSDPDKPLPTLEELGPLPFDVPEPATPVKLELDYNAIRNSILKQLSPYQQQKGTDQTKDLLSRHGGARLRDVPEDNLLGLLAELEAANA